MNTHVDCARNILLTALIDNHLKIDFSIIQYMFYYVPKMIRMHRELWTEEALIMFYLYKDKEKCDYLFEHFPCKDSHKTFYTQPVRSLSDGELSLKYKEIVSICSTLGDHLTEDLIPEYHIIESHYLEKIPNLIPFI